MSAEPVIIDERLIHHIGIREWGLPSMMIPGKMWRSGLNDTISCVVASKPGYVTTQTRPLVIAAPGTFSVMPDEWREALWSYVQEWPDSGACYGPFLALTEEQRCDYLRKWAEKLAKSDNIGCCAIANSIGEFAAYGYELPKPKAS